MLQKTGHPIFKKPEFFLVLLPSAIPRESIPHLYNLPGPQGWEEMRLDRYEKLTPSPLTDGLGGDRPRLDKWMWEKILPHSKLEGRQSENVILKEERKDFPTFG